MAAAVIKNITASKSDLAKPARKVVFDSLLAAIDLYAEHLPAFIRHRQGETSLYEFVCRSSAEAGSGGRGAGSGDDDDADEMEEDGSANDSANSSKGEGEGEGEHDFQLSRLQQGFPDFWNAVRGNTRRSCTPTPLSHACCSRLDFPP